MPTRRLSHLAVPVGVVAVVLLLVVPLPAFLLDLLIAFNITLALVVLLVAISVKRPLDFSVFPSLLLVATLLRLGLNVAATRLVLRDGYAGQRHRLLRPLRRRRLAGHRPGHLPDPHRHPVRRHHQRCRPRRRGRRALHPGRDARQADGDRRGPELRPDRRARGPPPPRRGRRRGRLLRRDGRWQQVRQGRRHRRHRDHGHQPGRRLRDRHAPARHEPAGGPAQLQPADDRRRPRLADPGAAASRSPPA